MKYLPKLHQLKVFQEVIRCGSIRSAARAMNQSQPALTRSMRELEHLLGTTLMERGSRGIVLTEAGKTFAARIQLILGELDRAVDEIEQINNTSEGSVIMGFSSLITTTIFPSVLEQFKKKFPKTIISVVEGQLSSLLPAMRAGQLDFAIGTMSSDVSLTEFIEEPLFSASFGIIARDGHPLINSTSLKQLHDAKWFLPSTVMGYYKNLESWLVALYGELKHAPVRSDSSMLALQLILKSDFICVAARASLSAFDMEGKIKMMPITDPLPKADYSLIYPRKTPLTLSARRFIDVFRWECQNIDWYATGLEKRE